MEPLRVVNRLSTDLFLVRSCANYVRNKKSDASGVFTLHPFFGRVVDVHWVFMKVVVSSKATLNEFLYFLSERSTEEISTAKVS